MLSLTRRLAGVVAVLTLACGGGDAPPAEGGASAAPALSTEELEQGLGPVRNLTLAPVSAALAEQGRTSFEMKCSACHRLDERYVGPALGDVLSRRRPEFVMNMILNPQEMTQRHPEVRAMVAEFMLTMPAQNVDQAEARALLEYLRSVQTQATQ